MTDEQWLAGLAEFDQWNERIFLALCVMFGIPNSTLDIGCGTGAMVKIARNLGVEAWGVDLLQSNNGYLRKHDLRQPLLLDRKFDLITCIEVAEHIAPEYAETLCKSMKDNISSRGWLVLSAAHPGQQGHQHVNCQPAYYWREKLHALGFMYNQPASIQLSLLLLYASGPLQWIPANTQVFRYQ